jgi:hypothetical protein
VFRLDDLISANFDLRHSTVAFYDVQVTTPAAVTTLTTLQSTTPSLVDIGGHHNSTAGETPAATKLLPSSKAAVHDLRPDRPVVIYLSRREVRPDLTVLNVVPTLSSLTGKEICDVTLVDVDKNSNGLPKFKVETSVLGVSSIQFALNDSDAGKPPLSSGLHRLRLECTTEKIVSDVSSRGSEMIPEVFAIDIELHIY